MKLTGTSDSSNHKVCRFKVNIMKILVKIALVLSILSCDNKLPKGSIKVLSKGLGTFEVYKVGKEEPFQLNSEFVGNFNEELKLSPGLYLILADCSSELVVVLPNTNKILTTHKVSFRTPTIPKSGDKFSILCSRHPKSKSNQILNNKFDLNILSGVRELLVGMNPLKLDLRDESKGSIEKEFILSAFKVESLDQMKKEPKYFISPIGGLISITEYQNFGNNMFLLPGKYKIQVNGSQMNIELKNGEVREVKPSFIRVEAPSEVQFDLASKITGEPLYIELNEGHRLDYNETYAVLPSTINLRLSSSKDYKSYEVSSEETKIIKVNGLLVDFGCSEFEWSCIGKRNVFLYRDKEDSFFAEGKTDSPVLFTDEEIWIDIEGSRNIRKKITTKNNFQILDVGMVSVRPRPSVKKGIYTDLLRVEVDGELLDGHSIDLSLQSDSQIPLLVGKYKLAHYVSFVDDDHGERMDHKSSISIKKNSEKSHALTVYLKDSKYKKYLERVEKRKRREINQIYSNYPILGPIIE